MITENEYWDLIYAMYVAAELADEAYKAGDIDLYMACFDEFITIQKDIEKYRQEYKMRILKVVSLS